MHNIQKLVCKLVTALLEKDDNCRGINGSFTTADFKLSFNFEFEI